MLIGKPLSQLSDVAAEAHLRIQQDIQDIDPVVGVSQHMRSNGIPADAMTIDCLKSGKRIILILHDDNPDIIRYQFSYREKDPESKFEVLPLNELTVQKLYQWMESYFSTARS